jgi:hypothetical protein
MPCLTYAPTLAAIEQTEVQSKRKENKAKLWIHGKKDQSECNLDA